MKPTSIRYRMREEGEIIWTLWVEKSGLNPFSNEFCVLDPTYYPGPIKKVEVQWNRKTDKSIKTFPFK